MLHLRSLLNSNAEATNYPVFVFPDVRQVLLLFFLFSTVEFCTAKTQIIGIYDLDSVINAVTKFKNINDSLENIKMLLHKGHDDLEADLNVRLAEADRDSQKWSPVIKSLKKAEITNMGINISNYDRQMQKELEGLISARVKLINDPILKILIELCRKKNYTAVIPKTGEPHVITIDITERCVTSEIIGYALKNE